jgi:hypothetical protein
MQRYTVTDADAVFVAGKRVPESRIIDLTDEEARYELLAGAVTAASGADAVGPAAAEPVRRGRRERED